MSERTRPRPTESKFRLLYLGTDLKLIAAVREVLTEPDYRLVACSHPESAVLFLRSEIPYDLLLIDFEWQGTEGMELARLVHSLGHRERMPIILVAPTNLSSDVRTLARAAGINECVTKTPDGVALSEAIRRLIDSLPV
jgi:CheY-like chemotaxis protein